MQLRHLAIPHFRNLRNVVIDFATQLSPMLGAATGATPQAIRSHALIGQNGTGKSNLLEVLITIFRDVDLDRDATLDYTLEYEIRGHSVRIHADVARQRRPFVWVDGQSQSQGHLLKNRELLPSHIFAYYSGRRIAGIRAVRAEGAAPAT
jgi:recombinational DNA repair ATPase RecF